jgi:hypothetical protein
MGNLSAASNDLTVKWLRRIARILSILILGIALVTIVGHLLVPEPTEADYPPIENLLLVLMSLSVLGLGIAWRWEGLGGAICLGFFVLHLALYWAIRHRFFPLSMLGSFSPLVITGILFLVCWWKSRDPR